MAVDVEPLRGRPDRPSGPIGLRRWHVAIPRIIERAAVREILMGAQDNLTNVLAVMLGVSIGSGRSDLVAPACISSAVAEAVSMGGVLYSSTRAGNNHERRVQGDVSKAWRPDPEPIGAYDVHRRADRWPRPTGSLRRAAATSGGRRFRRDFHRGTVPPSGPGRGKISGGCGGATVSACYWSPASRRSLRQRFGRPSKSLEDLGPVCRFAPRVEEPSR